MPLVLVHLLLLPAEALELPAHRHLLIVCTGTAITPVLGLARYYDPSLSMVTLVWIVRDKSLISLLRPAINPATHLVIYYTGKDPQTREQLPLHPRDCELRSTFFESNDPGSDAGSCSDSATGDARNRQMRGCHGAHRQEHFKMHECK